MPLFFIDRQAFAICQEVMGGLPAKQRGTSFAVYYGFYDLSRGAPNGNAFTISDFHGMRRNIIFITPKMVKSKYLRIAIAHELGHIIKSTSDELIADRFALDLLGDKKFIREGLLHFGLTENSERIMALSDKSPPAK